MNKSHKLLIAVTLFIFITGCQSTLPPASQEDIYQAATLTGEWFLNNQNDNFVYYEYYPDTDTYSDTDHPLRELASLWAVVRLADFTGDDRYQTLADKGINYFRHYIYEDKDNSFLYLQYGESDVNIGDSAFMILSLIESQKPDFDDVITGLADGILFLQTEAGYIPAYFHSDTDKNQDYLPGEAMLALMSTYEYTGDDKYLKAVQLSYQYYRDYWRENPNTAFVPWHSRADYQLYQATQNPAIADFIFEMNDFVLADSNPRSNCQNFQFTKYGTMAVLMEGTVQALALSQEINDLKHQTCYQNFIDEVVPYIISYQVPADSNLPLAAIGGIWDGPKQRNHRIDRNQHFVMALMDIYNLNE